MKGNREQQCKVAHTSQCTDTQAGRVPVNHIIMPTSLSTGHQYKAVKVNKENETKVIYPPHSAARQTIARPVCLVLMPAPSTADQQQASTSGTNQSEKKKRLLPQSVVKWPKAASSQSALTDQPPKEVPVYPVLKGHRLTDAEVLDDGTFHSNSALSTAVPNDEGQSAHMCSDLEVIHSSHFSTNQSGEDSIHLSGTSLLPEAQQPEHVNSLKETRLKVEHSSDCPNNHPGMIPPHLVVMTASSKEINYRIKAFLARKRAELDVQNVEEYCHHIGMNPNVCARVDATIHQHRKQKRRKFEFAPQSEEKAVGANFMSKDACHEQLPLSVTHPILEERVDNAEEYLRLGKPVPKDIYSRLKRIEDRILQLEGISPEYTSDAPVNLHPPRPLPKIKRRCTIVELDAKIAELQKKFENNPATSSKKETEK